MNVLAKVTVGRQLKPQIHVVYGLPGVGKTTFASNFPKPLIIDLENGSSHLDVSRIEDVKDLATFRQIIGALLQDEHEFKTVVVDSIESLEGLLSDFVCQEGSVKSIEAYAGGFGKGFHRLRELMRELMIEFRSLADKRGVTVILIGHSLVKSHTDPAENVAYDRFTMRVNDKMGSIIRDLADNVFFARHKIYHAKENGKVKAFSQDERVMMTTWKAAYDAKTRIQGLPEEIPLDYEAFRLAVENAKPKAMPELKQEIMDMLPGLDGETRSKAEAAIAKATTTDELNAIKARIQTLINA